MLYDNFPLGAFFRRLFDPLIMLVTLYLVLQADHEIFNRYYLLLMIVIFLVGNFVFEQIDLSRKLRNRRFLAFASDIFLGWIIIVAVLILIERSTGLRYEYSEHTLLIWVGVTPLVLLVSNMVAHWIFLYSNRFRVMRSGLIIGANKPGAAICEKLKTNPYFNIDIKGYFDDRDGGRRVQGLSGVYLGKVSSVVSYVLENNIQVVFVSLPIAAQPRILSLLDELQDTTVSIYFVPDISTFELMQARLDHVDGVPVVGICETPFTGLNGVLKRASDIVLSVFILTLIFPILIAIACGVKISSPGSVIFRQRRYGLNGEEIIVYKFRSMTVSEDGKHVAQATRNDQRVTKFGAFIRRTSLDELPQFINVLQGRMSIVGPRPHAVAHNELYRKLIKGYMLRHKAMPGITGWAQVNGLRGETETLDKMQSRIEHDLAYLRNWSLPLDLWIIILTVREVFLRRNSF